MKKLVFKTIAITLVVTLCAAMITFGALSLFAPRICAGFFDGVGSYSASVFFYEKQYEKTDDVKDLAILIDKLDADVQPALKEFYLEKMLLRSDFEEFCSEQDKKDHAISSKEYYNGSYALILAKNKRLEKALEICSEYVKKSTYTENNPYRLILSDYADGATIEELKEIKNSLNVRRIYLDNDEGRKLADQDFKALDTLIQQKQETED